MGLKDYPDWVIKHKQKGTEIRYIRGMYYIYSYHYEKVNNKNKKITGKYLGRITQEGLIPPQPFKEIIEVKEYYSTVFAFHILSNIISSISTRFKSTYRIILSNAFINKLFNGDKSKYDKSYLSILFPNDIAKLNKKTIEEINRASSMIEYQLNKFLKDTSINSFFENINDIYIVQIKNSWIIAKISESSIRILEKYNMKLEIEYGKTN